MRGGIHLWVVVILIWQTGCQEPFSPDVPLGDLQNLVVDGTITDGPGPYRVHLSRVLSLQAPQEKLDDVAGADVIIEEENGIQEHLDEVDPGMYVTSVIQGKPGRRYRLSILLQGNRYLSSWETLHTSPPIDSVYWTIENKGTTDKDMEVSGIQFYVDSHGQPNELRNYRYEWVETWKIGVTYPSEYDYIGGDQIVRTKFPVHTCWKEHQSTTVNLASTAGLNENRVSGHKLGFIVGEDERFTRRYSLLVRQFAIDDEEYFFWKVLQESSENNGSLFDKQPSRAMGNMTNPDNPDEVVIGYFSAVGVSEKRIFISEKSTLSMRKDCQIALDTLLKSTLGSTYESRIFEELDKGNYYYRPLSTPFQGVLGALIARPSCADCRLKGGDIKKPDFWDE